jgi:hypothetical protein
MSINQRCAGLNSRVYLFHKLTAFGHPDALRRTDAEVVFDVSPGPLIAPPNISNRRNPVELAARQEVALTAPPKCVCLIR